MIMRAVHVDEPFADLLKDRERGGAAVHKLTVTASGGEGSFEKELIVFAGLEAVFLEESAQWGVELGGVKRGFDSALIGLSADERAVGPFAQHEIECANQDGLACPRLAADGVVAGAEPECEVGD